MVTKGKGLYTGSYWAFSMARTVTSAKVPVSIPVRRQAGRGRTIRFLDSVNTSANWAATFAGLNYALLTQFTSPLYAQISANTDGLERFLYTAGLALATGAGGIASKPLSDLVGRYHLISKVIELAAQGANIFANEATGYIDGLYSLYPKFDTSLF